MNTIDNVLPDFSGGGGGEADARPICIPRAAIKVRTWGNRDLATRPLKPRLNQTHEDAMSVIAANPDARPPGSNYIPQDNNEDFEEALKALEVYRKKDPSKGACVVSVDCC